MTQGPGTSHPIRAVCFDAAGTLLHLAEPVARTYARIAQAHGVAIEAPTIARRFPEAFAAQWGGPRMHGDGRPFWRHVVRTCTGSDDENLFEALYDHYAHPAAWRLEPGAEDALVRLRAMGLGVALLSNWDTRLAGLLDALDLSPHFDFIGISGALGVEKPDARAFALVADALGVPLASVLHTGDSGRTDVMGARAAGARSVRWAGFASVFGALEADGLRSTDATAGR